MADIDPRAFHYRSTRGDDVAIRMRLKELASQRRRFGYRRLHILLKRESVEINGKKLYRLYRGERLTVRKRCGRTSLENTSFDGSSSGAEPALEP